MALRNTFTKIAGSTYRCDTCERMTRNTGVQGLGCRLCPHCFDLAGIENEISDGYSTAAEKLDEVTRLLDAVRAKGGKPDENFAELIALTKGA